MSNKTSSVLDRIAIACEENSNFDKMVKFCEVQIELFVEKIEADNKKPTTIPRSPASPRDVLLNILLPVIPISPNETELLLEYLNYKYIKFPEKTIVGGDHFHIKKCFLKNNYRLYTHDRHCYYY